MSNDTTKPLPVRRGGDEPRGLPQGHTQELRQALEGALFPLTTEQLVQIARENETTSPILSLLGDLPGQKFSTLDEVLQRLTERLTARGALAPGRESLTEH